MYVECDCGRVFKEEQIVKLDDGGVCWMCPNCGDCREYF